MLHLMPVVIKELLLDNVDVADKTTLKTIFGNLWPLIIKEANRQRHKITKLENVMALPMHPIMRLLLRAERNLFNSQQEIHRNNDIKHNTLKQLATNEYDKITMKLAKHWMNKKNEVSPAERILKLAAILIRQHLLKDPKRQQHKSLYNNINNEHNTVKRDSPKDLNNGLLLHFRNKSLKSENDKLSIEGRPRNKREVLMYMDSISEENWQPENNLVSTVGDHETAKLKKRTSIQKDKNEDKVRDEKLKNKKLKNKIVGDAEEYYEFASYETEDDEYKDYAFDISGYDDDELLRQMYGAPTSSDYEGSISELLQLAAKHNKRRQRNSEYLKTNHNKFKTFVSASLLNTENQGGDDYF